MWLLYVFLLLFAIIFVLVRNHACGLIYQIERPVKNKPESRLASGLRHFFFGFNSYRRCGASVPAASGREYTVHEFSPERGVVLRGWHIPGGADRGLVILLNWLGGCKSDNLEAAEIFLGLGYEVFLFDLRGNGDSSGRKTAFGYYEYRDVLCGIEYAKFTFHPKTLVIYGVSLGAVACLRAFYAGEIRGVDALIFEAPFDRLKNTVRHRARAMGVPEFLGDLVLAGCGVILKYNPYSFNPISYAEEINLPVLLFQRNGDKLVTTGEVMAIYQKLGSVAESELVLVEDSGHGTIVYSHRELFCKECKNFLAGMGL